MSLDTSIATVDQNGKITGQKIGTTQIRITAPGNDTYASADKMITVYVQGGWTYVYDYKGNGTRCRVGDKQYNNPKLNRMIDGEWEEEDYLYIQNNGVTFMIRKDIYVIP